MLRLLNQADVDKDVEEEEEENGWCKSTLVCPCCQEPIMYTDEIFLLEVTESAQDGGQIVTQSVLDDEGDYRYPPSVVHLECWEEMLEQIREGTEDAPPVACENGILFCWQCESTIGSFEPYVSLTFGEVHVSHREPNGQFTEHLERLKRADAVCLSCMVHVVEDYLDDWEDLFENLPLHDEEDEEENER